MVSQNKLRLHNKDLSTSMERLATGSRINQAKDDPFRNYETQNLNNEISKTAKARQNTSDGAALLQIADGTCTEVQNILVRIKELSVQAANDTLTSNEREYLDIETQALLKEINRIIDATTFNSKQIFGNKGDSFSDEQRTIDEWTPFTNKNADGKETRAGVLHIGVGGADRTNELKLSIPEISAKNLGLDTLCLTYQAGATKAIDTIDSAISSLITIRSYMGSTVSRLEDHVSELETRNISLNDYSGKIRDTDFAKEVTEMASSQIKLQAAVSLLTQGNSKVGKVLEILS
jgi:flagellin